MDKLDELRIYFVFSNKKWFQFEGHLWKKKYIPENQSQRLVIICCELLKKHSVLDMEDVVLLENFSYRDFCNFFRYPNFREDLDENTNLIGFSNGIYDLRNRSFSNYPEDVYQSFEDKLDRNPNLIGFNNGIFDLKKGVFRSGSPEDYVSLSVGYDYVEHCDQDPNVKSVLEYFELVFPDEDTRDYVFRLLASVLDGSYLKKPQLLKGSSNANGITTFVNFVNACFGDYFVKMPNYPLVKHQTEDIKYVDFVYSLKGKRLVHINCDDFINPVLIDKISSSHSFYGKPIYQKNGKIFKSQLTLLVEGGSFPNLNGMLEVPFESKFQSNGKILNNLETLKDCLMWILLRKYSKPGQKILDGHLEIKMDRRSIERDNGTAIEDQGNRTNSYKPHGNNISSNGSIDQYWRIMDSLHQKIDPSKRGSKLLETLVEVYQSEDFETIRCIFDKYLKQEDSKSILKLSIKYLKPEVIRYLLERFDFKQEDKLGELLDIILEKLGLAQYLKADAQIPILKEILGLILNKKVEVNESHLDRIAYLYYRKRSKYMLAIYKMIFNHGIINDNFELKLHPVDGYTVNRCYLCGGNSGYYTKKSSGLMRYITNNDYKVICQKCLDNN